MLTRQRQAVLLAATCLLLCASCMADEESAKKRVKTLVLLGSPRIRSTHSTFLASLDARGHQLVYKLPDDEVQLQEYGAFHYDHVLVLAEALEDFSTVSVKHLLEFIDSGRSVLIAAGANSTEIVREFANECGVDYEDPETAVVDHLAYDATLDATGRHTAVYTSRWTNGTAIVRKAPAAPVLYSGIGQTLTEESKYLTPVLLGSPTSVSADPRKKVPSGALGEVVLVSALQTRNNGRALFAGSLDLFSDKYFNAPVGKFGKSGNEDFCRQVSLWTFRESGVLRAVNLNHRQADGHVINGHEYRIKDTIRFEITLEEYDGVRDTWTPFTQDDVQLEFVMLDPFIRQLLAHDNKGHYSLTFQVPDNFGVYKFRVDYNRHGYSHVFVEHQVSLRPYRHDEYERFIDTAFPYYASSFSMMAGFFVFGIIFLYNGKV